MDDPGHQADRPASPAKRLGRRDTLKLLGVTLTGAVAAGVGAAARATQATGTAPARMPAASADRRGPAWRLRPLATGTEPRSFSTAEFAALAAAVDRIIPDTDTPGARTAGVHWFLDDISRIETRLRDQLRAGMRRLDDRARAQHGTPFAGLGEREQDALLASLDPSAPGGQAAADDRAFFGALKAQTIDAYYKSEMGQVGELEWVGHEFNDDFPGACTHGDPMVHPRPNWPRSRG